MPFEEIIEKVYRRIEAYAANPVFIHLVEKERALARAREVGSMPATPLRGRIVAVKDNIDVAGMPTTAGCREFSYVPKRSAHAVQKLLDAGAIVIGKTNLDQFATGLVGTRSPYGACRNAYVPEYISGGSSSGSAVAVALGMAELAVGTDTAGSGRVPAAFNNLVGLKPTRGLVSTAGVVPACRSLDCVSIFAGNVAAAIEALEVMQGGDRDDPYSRTGEPAAFFPQRFRFAVPKQLEFHGDEGYSALFARAVRRLEDLGGSAAQIDYGPFLEVQALLYGPWVAERTAALEKHLGNMLPVTKEIIESGRRYSASDLFTAQHRLAALRAECERVLQPYDVLVVPGAPTIYRIAEVERAPLELNARLGRYTNFVNLLDMAAITVPAGFRADGLPFGITLVGPAFADRALAALGARFTGEAGLEAKTDAVRVAVVGAHLSGMPLNHQLTERGARLAGAARTAPLYRLFALEGKPGLVRTPESGARIEVEVWEMSAAAFGSFVALVPPPLGIGTLQLESGEQVKGFLCEHYAVRDRPDITAHGGWRDFLAKSG